MTALPPLPVTVVAGYLGAGKTTLVNHLLRHAKGRRLSVLVNDFGKIAIDADLITARDGDSMTLANGCVCCSIGGDLYRALTRALDRRPRADALVIEASGVAEPARLAEIAQAEPDLRMARIVVLVDAPTWPERSTDALVGALLRRQVAAADLIVLNKADLVDDRDLAAVEGSLAILAPGAEFERAVQASVPPERVLAAASGQTVQTAPSHGNHEDRFLRWSFTGEASFSAANLDEFLARLPSGVHRLKGFVALKDRAEPIQVQAEGGRVQLEPAPPGSLGSLGTPVCRLVAIGPLGAFDPRDMDALAAAYFGSQ